MATLQLTASTLAVTPAAGQLEFDGHFYATDSANVRSKLNRLIHTTAQATTSGTSIDFTTIPNGVKRITVMFQGVSTSGTSIWQLQLGDIGGIETTGYLGATSGQGAANTVAGNNLTTGFGINNGGQAADIVHGVIQLLNMSGNVWVASGSLARSNVNYTITTGGSKELSGTLDRVRITTVNGTDTFDAGSINILYEG